MRKNRQRKTCLHLAYHLATTFEKRIYLQILKKNPLIFIGDEIPKEDCTKLLEALAGAEDEDGFFPYTPFLDKLCGK